MYHAEMVVRKSSRPQGTDSKQAGPVALGVEGKDQNGVGAGEFSGPLLSCHIVTALSRHGVMGGTPPL